MEALLEGGLADGIRRGAPARDASGAVDHDKDVAAGQPDLSNPVLAMAGPGILYP
jgi:hypothetical protein